ncbi:carboxypeptidase D-like [Lampetra fluviatilis]
MAAPRRGRAAAETESESELGTELLGGGALNALGVDLDTDFTGNSSAGRTLQAETQALGLGLLLGRTTFTAALTLSAGSLLATHPPDNPALVIPGPGVEVLRSLASTYANNHPTMHLAGRHNCHSDRFEEVKGGVEMGSNFHPHTGSLQDFSVSLAGCPHVTAHVSCCPFPAASALPSLWRENRAALLGFVAEAHRGVRGVVVDATTGVALQETELLLPWGAVRTDGAEFRVYLPVGTHAIGVRAPGYTERVLTVTVRQADLTASVVLVSLEPDGAPRHSLPRPTGASLLAVAVVAAVVAVVVAVVAVVGGDGRAPLGPPLGPGVVTVGSSG